MRTQFGNPAAVAREIGGQFRPGKDKIVRRLFGPVAKVIWPANTDAHIATILDCDPRTARRYLSGELAAPAKILAAINTELTKDD